MHLANTYYGHSDLLGAFAGRSGCRPAIFGMLQHGWNAGTGFAPDDPPVYVRSRIPAFVWNERNLTCAQAAGYGNAVAIGAPFLYLVEMEVDLMGAGAAVRPSIAYPFHGWEQEAASGGTHDAFAAELAEREPSGSTVCLYWLDYGDQQTRAAYKRRGLRVVCHGHRHDPRFLRRQLRELRSHRRLVTNRISTALWYGAYLGMEVELYGPQMGFAASADEIADAYAAERLLWPELFEGPVPSDRAGRLGARELGADYVRHPAELRELLGWTGWRRCVAGALAPITRGLMRAKMHIESW